MTREGEESRKESHSISFELQVSLSPPPPPTNRISAQQQLQQWLAEIKERKIVRELKLVTVAKAKIKTMV